MSATASRRFHRRAVHAGNVFPARPRRRRQRPVDPDIPLLPTANYSSDMTEKFLKLRGYSPENYYSYLYEGESDAAKRFRWDYYKTLGELMASNYSGQIGAWCEDNGVSLTGHFLLEEDIYMHPIFNGNIMRICRICRCRGSTF
ncbi:MAG: glycosyl hydrolase [Candidatus Borkfalkia sp.]